MNFKVGVYVISGYLRKDFLFSWSVILGKYVRYCLR